MVTRLLSTVGNVAGCAQVLVQRRGKAFQVDQQAIQACVYHGSSKARAVIALANYSDEQLLMADYTLKGGKQVRYIPANMRVPCLHHVKEHGKLYIVH